MVWEMVLFPCRIVHPASQLQCAQSTGNWRTFQTCYSQHCWSFCCYWVFKWLFLINQVIVNCFGWLRRSYIDSQKCNLFAVMVAFLFLLSVIYHSYLILFNLMNKVSVGARWMPSSGLLNPFIQRSNSGKSWINVSKISWCSAWLRNNDNEKCAHVFVMFLVSLGFFYSFLYVWK